MHSSPQRRGKVTIETIKNTIDQLRENDNSLKKVVFSGGEPTLLHSLLFDAITYCVKQGLNTRLETNAHWATTRKKADGMLGSLRNCGLSEIAYSLDDYHASEVSAEKVLTAWYASKNKGFHRVLIANCHGHTSKFTPEFIRSLLDEAAAVVLDGQEIPSCTESQNGTGTRYLISSSGLQRMGRGRALAEESVVYPDRQSSLNQRCPWASGNMVLSAGSHLIACSRINAHGNEFLDFGDVRNANAVDLFRLGEKRVVIQAMRKYGPWFLMNFVNSIATRSLFKSRYASVCEICEDVMNIAESRRILKECFPRFYTLYEIKQKISPII